MKPCLILQHVEPESAFAIGEQLQLQGIELDVRRIFNRDSVPLDADGFSGLVIMGGPMSAASDEGFPTRQVELSLLADAVLQGTPVLGVCLGAQLLALAAGGAVFKGSVGPEIGWGQVTLQAATTTDLLLHGLPPSLEALHWHGDTFDLPPDATHLASSSAYKHQAFRIGANAWGFQFHLEVDQGAIDGFLDSFGDEARAAAGGPSAIRTRTPVALGILEPVRNVVLDRFAQLVAGNGLSAMTG